MRILVTGGSGFIGSHTVVQLVEAGHTPIIFDNFSNSSSEVLNRLSKILGNKPLFIQGDVRDKSAAEDALKNYDCEAVIHFAGVKAVGESMTNPLKYYSNNVSGSQVLLEAMVARGIKKIIFSSSATVYGEPQTLPIPESHRLRPSSIYGETKLFVENMLRALFNADPEWSISILRYFNPVGAHPSGLIGEDPYGIPNNLMPFVSQVAVGRREKLQIFGDDYSTPDGTGVRDYIHVNDLAAGHVAALKLFSSPHCTEINLGTGKGFSVLELITAYGEVSRRDIPYEIVGRRAGDVASCYADPRLANKLLDWYAHKKLREMTSDSWNWQAKNPLGYGI